MNSVLTISTNLFIVNFEAEIRKSLLRFAFRFPLSPLDLSPSLIASSPHKPPPPLSPLPFSLTRMKERSKKVNYAEVDSDVDLDEEERELERMKQRQQQLVQVNKNKGTKAGDTFGATSEYTLNPTASNLKRMER